MIKLYNYQIKYLETMPTRGIMAADTGVGKTFMALAHYEKQYSKSPCYLCVEGLLDNDHFHTPTRPPLLILAPASKVRTGDWERDITEYFGAGNEPDYEIYSYEKFSRIPSNKQFLAGKRAIWHSMAPKYGGKQYAVIADEVHRAKSWKSGIGKALFEVTKDTPFFIGLSATPLPNGWIDFANYSKVFGYTKGITEFKKKYVKEEKYKGFPEIVGYYNTDQLKQQWQAVSRRLLKKDALDLPSRTFKGVNFSKPAEYKKMIITRLDADGEMLDSSSKLIPALRQTLTPAKIEYLGDVIDGTNENVVIFYNYISERSAILEMLAKRHSDRVVFRQDGERHELPAKKDWSGVERSVTLAHYRSGSTGVEMTYATVVIYFSPTYSYADYIQSIGRVYRNGQTAKTTFYNFRTAATIEAEVYDALRNKQDFQHKQWEVK